jgi:two-component system alkaline phosphatase synthesis response regulator PhoP
MRKIYSLEDDLNVSSIIEEALTLEGFIVKTFSDYRLFFDAIKKEKPDLVLLDLTLPLISGEEVLRYIKTNIVMHNIPIIVVSGKTNEKERLYCLDNGADDYISKPFSLKELISRINAVLRRFGMNKTLIYENIELDVVNRIISVDKENIVVTPKEFDLMLYLIERIDKIVTREELLKLFWNSSMSNSRSIDMHIKAIRQKIFSKTNLEIITLLKVGYKLTRR